jgi:4-hydroxybenzoate polyprenyltransferase
MKKWFTFFKERTPLASYLLITMGPVATGYYLSTSRSVEDGIIGFVGFFLFFLVLRMMDEFKDYDKDILAHPTRPLPRGLIPLPEFHLGINIGIALMLVFNVFLFLTGMKCSAFIYALVVIHLWLMYKEFYIGVWLNSKPLLYAFTHQLILVSLCLFCLSVYRVSGTYHFTKMDWIYSFSVLFAFFSYEVCRKLDPAAHPVLKTYRYVYGMAGVYRIVGTLIILHLLTIHQLFAHNFRQYFFYITPVLLIVSIFLLARDKVKFKMVELLATLNLLVFLYSGILYAMAM